MNEQPTHAVVWFRGGMKNYQQLTAKAAVEFAAKLRARGIRYEVEKLAAPKEK